MKTKMNAESIGTVESYTSKEIRKNNKLNSIVGLSFINCVNIKIKDRLLKKKIACPFCAY